MAKCRYLRAKKPVLIRAYSEEGAVIRIFLECVLKRALLFEAFSNTHLSARRLQRRSRLFCVLPLGEICTPG